MNVSKKLKELIGEVEASYKVASGAIAAAVSVVAFVVGSKTLAFVVVAATVLALASSYLVTVSVYRNQSKENCLRPRRRYLLLAGIAAIVGVTILIVVDPDVATMSPLIEGIREFLFSAMFLFNILIALSAFGLVYGLTAAMVLSSGQMWRRRTT